MPISLRSLFKTISKMIRNKNWIAFAISLTILYSSVLQAAKKHPSHFISTIQVDGKSTEWDSLLNYYNSETKIQYGFANNQQYLFVCVKIFDADQQMQFMHSGLKIFIDEKGKRNELNYVKIPVEKPMPDFSKHDEMPHPKNFGARRTEQPINFEMPDSSQIQRLSKTDATKEKLEVVGFQNIPNGEFVLNEQRNPIKAFYDWDDFHALICEFAIPLNAFNIADFTKPIGLGFEINVMEMEEPQMPGGGMPPMGGGAPPMGGDGGGFGGGGQMPPPPNMNGQGAFIPKIKISAKTFWQKILIAKR